MTYGRLCLRRLYVVGTVDHARIVTTSGKILPSIQMVRFLTLKSAHLPTPIPWALRQKLQPLCHALLRYVMFRVM